jgi:hypothetical protein
METVGTDRDRNCKGRLVYAGSRARSGREDVQTC